jgi:hypothetical protein
MAIHHMNLIAQMMTNKPKALCLYNYEGKNPARRKINPGSC